MHSSCTCLDSWKFVEIHWTVRAPLVCSISGVFFLEDRIREIFLGFARGPLHETTPLCGMEQHGIPVVHTCLFLLL